VNDLIDDFIDVISSGLDYTVLEKADILQIINAIGNEEYRSTLILESTSLLYGIETFQFDNDMIRRLNDMRNKLTFFDDLWKSL
jgi:hypothetical protein